MEARKSYFMKPVLAVVLGCCMAFAVACGDDDDGGNPTPNGGTKNTAGTGGKNTSGSNNGGSSGKGGSNNNNGGAGNETSDAGEGPGPQPTGGQPAGGAPADCVDEGDLGCYSCKPETQEQFYNACPTDGCEPFDNSKLTAIVGGELPDL